MTGAALAGVRVMKTVTHGWCMAVAIATATAFAGSSLAAVAPPGFLETSAKAGVMRDGELVFSGSRITIPIIAERDATFEIHGRVDPTVSVPAGARLRFELANDSILHAYALDVSSAAPPYTAERKHLPAARPASLHSVPGLFAATGLVPAAVKGTTRSLRLSVGTTQWFKLAQGTYHYVCASSAHRYCGMYGKIIARAATG